MSERQLITLETIKSIEPIPDADAIEVAYVRGWAVVVRKEDNFKVGDEVLYFEIDSAIPLENPSFEFLANRGSRRLTNSEGTEGWYHVIKTIKLRGQYSQGLVLHVREVFTSGQIILENALERDLADELGVFKYEPPLPQSGEATGGFFSHLRKTDSERVQNLTDAFLASQYGPGWDATEKIDGTSITIFKDTEKGLRVASRNWELRRADNVYWKAADSIADLIPDNFSVQAEVYGQGIQNNPLNLKDQRISVFGLFDPNGNAIDRMFWPPDLLIHAVPLRQEFKFPKTTKEAIADVNGIKSAINPGKRAEGIVWHSYGLLSIPNFKVISNEYILKLKD